MIILAFIVIALVAGFIANWLVGRGRNYETWELFVVGIIGSFVGGLIFSLLLDHNLDIHITGLVGSTLGAIVVLALYGPVRAWWRKRNAPATPTSTIKPKR